MDCNNAHVQPNGRYHYHGTPSDYIDRLGGSNIAKMKKVGFVADGFPIYYKYGYSDNGTIKAYSSGYQLKKEVEMDYQLAMVVLMDIMLPTMNMWSEYLN